MTNIEKKMIARLLEIKESGHFSPDFLDKIRKIESDRFKSKESLQDLKITADLESTALPPAVRLKIPILNIYRSIIRDERPLYLIANDSFDDIGEKEWWEINQKKASLKPLIKGTGRIISYQNNTPTDSGTAFLCASNRIITNRHVASIFTRKQASTPQLFFIPGWNVGVDFKAEFGSATSLAVKVTAPVLLLEDHDIAILEIESTPSGIVPLPLMAAAPAKLENRTVVIIGFPGKDPDESYFTVDNLLKDTENTKHLQPGKMKGLRQDEIDNTSGLVLSYDCTTLKGNSGSALIDVEKCMVMGIHFKGASYTANYAVPSWELAKNKSILASGVMFK